MYTPRVVERRRPGRIVTHRHRREGRRVVVTVALVLMMWGFGRPGRGPAPAHAFPYVVKRGETVARLAERMYGRVELERLIVAANGLDGRRGAAVVPGMRLEVPALGHRRAEPGDTWPDLAEVELGDAKRADVLAHINDTHAWRPPAVGREVQIPFNLRYVASAGDTTESVAYRFLGRRDRAWMVASYNRLQRARLIQGEVLLIPVHDLTLTVAGRNAAAVAGTRIGGEAEGRARAVQEEAEAELPRLVQAVRRGRYLEAVAQGAGLIARGGLTQPQRATVYRQLTEAYVALDATGAATDACDQWRRNDPRATLDPIRLSPKIIDACVATRPSSAAPVSTPKTGDAEP